MYIYILINTLYIYVYIYILCIYIMYIYTWEIQAVPHLFSSIAPLRSRKKASPLRTRGDAPANTPGGLGDEAGCRGWHGRSEADHQWTY